MTESYKDRPPTPEESHETVSKNLSVLQKQIESDEPDLRDPFDYSMLWVNKRTGLLSSADRSGEERGHNFEMLAFTLVFDSVGHPPYRIITAESFIEKQPIENTVSPEIRDIIERSIAAYNAWRLPTERKN